MKDWHNRLPERMSDDGLEERFWSGYIEEKRKRGGPPRPDRYAETILKELQALIPPGSSVLEIGPGWGNYTMDVARAASSYDCFDSSASILDYLREAAEALDLPRMRFIHGKWEEYEAEADRYDVVFGMNCYYRMMDIDKALLNMNRTAKTLAVVGMTSGPEAPHLRDIARELGYRVKFTRRDYIHLMNVLYQLGIDANCRIVPLERTYTYDSEEQLFEDQLKKIMEPSFDRDAAKRIVSRYVQPIDGRPGFTHRFAAALLYWRPVSEAALNVVR
ncbi:class I SAM-dependent methyltransferase [Paenibacillus sp. TRM 82003]|nr:class I SAM-dependent methyltransferase [Paenibacillus sp. TRM 82003]